MTTFSRMLVAGATLAVGLWGCTQESGTITIRGDLSGLPDGRLVLENRTLKHDTPTYIDTVDTVNGRFTFAISRDSFPEPIEVYMTHYDRQGIKRVFDFPNNRKDYVLGTFLLEDGTEINGKLMEREIPRVFRAPTNVKAVFPDRPIAGSRQSNVMYNDTADFRRVTNVASLKRLIEQHPYSFYYLNILKNRIADLSDAQFNYVFGAFDREVRESRTGQRLKTYVASRGATHLNHQVRLPAANGQLQPVLSQSASQNIIVLWASWCGPCRREIPELKKIYADFGRRKSVAMVSVSIDERAERWKQALAEEQMPWRQLLMTDEVATYAHEYFGYEHAVPLLIIVDSKGRIWKRMEGYSPAHIAEIRAELSRASDE